MHRNPSGMVVPPGPRMLPKINSQIPTNANSNNAARTNSFGVQCTSKLAPHKIIGGATSKAPAASPIHQVNHMEEYLDHWTGSASARQATPQVALTMVLRMAARS